MNEEKFIEILASLGLSIPESRVYLTLSELKESKTGEICDKSKVASSKIYNILESLIKKGLVSYRVQNNTKIFIASSPAVLGSLFEEKQKKIENEKKDIFNLMDLLKNKQQHELPFSKYKYFEGMAGIRSLWIGLTQDLDNLPKDEEVLVYTGVKKAYEAMLGLYEEFHKKRLKNKIKYRIIYPLNETEVAKKRKTQLAQVKFLDLKNEAEWGIMGNKLFIQYITQKVPRGFLIEDELFALTFKQVFEQVWNSAKK